LPARLALAFAAASLFLLGSATQAAVAAPTCGGEVPPPNHGAQWTCTFDDEFDSTTGDPSSLNTSLWAPQVTETSGFTTGPSGNYVCYHDSPQNIWVSGGALHLTVLKASSSPFTCGQFATQYTGGMVSTYYSFHQTYGRFEVRAELPQTTVAGLQEALWMWPVNSAQYGAYPASGEVDFSEFYSLNSSTDVPFIHYNYDPTTVNPSTHTNAVTSRCQIPLNQYNDYAVTWSPGNFTITINGNTCLVDNYVPDGGLTSPQPFDQPFFISLTQGFGVPGYGNEFNPSKTPLPATLSIDYVRVWSAGAVATPAVAAATPAIRAATPASAPPLGRKSSETCARLRQRSGVSGSHPRR
jgi:beta-glucanase (GH16 family)